MLISDRIVHVCDNFSMTPQASVYSLLATRYSLLWSRPRRVMKFLCLPLTALALICPLSAFAEGSTASVPKAEPVTAPYAILESFVGGGWFAEIPSQSGGLPSRVEMHFSWVENKQGLRFDS